MQQILLGYSISILYGLWNQARLWHLCRFSSVAQWCPTICDPMNHSTPGLPVHHQLPESTQIHIHWVGDAIKPSHPLSSPSPPALNLSQHQGLLKSVSSSHQVAKVLEFHFNISPTFLQVPIVPIVSYISPRLFIVLYSFIPLCLSCYIICTVLYLSSLILSVVS